MTPTNFLSFLDCRTHTKNVHTAPRSELLASKLSRSVCVHPGCDREFSTAYAAKYHYERVHCGRSPPKIPCRQCGKAYVSLARHVREAHAENR